MLSILMNFYRVTFLDNTKIQKGISPKLQILKRIEHIPVTVVITRGGSLDRRLRVGSGDCSLISPVPPTAG